MNQVVNVSKYEENNIQQTDSNRIGNCEAVVDALINQGLPRIYNPDNFISKISNAFNISTQEARTCLRLAVKQLESEKTTPKEENKEVLNGQCGYFYPRGFTASQDIPNAKKDGMDSLSSLASYNRMMFGIK